MGGSIKMMVRGGDDVGGHLSTSDLLPSWLLLLLLLYVPDECTYYL